MGSHLLVNVFQWPICLGFSASSHIIKMQIKLCNSKQKIKIVTHLDASSLCIDGV
jgi:hypothetical protein